MLYNIISQLLQFQTKFCASYLAEFFMAPGSIYNGSKIFFWSCFDIANNCQNGEENVEKK